MGTLSIEQQLRSLRHQLCQTRNLVTTPVRLQIIVGVTLDIYGNYILPINIKEFTIKNTLVKPVRNIKVDSVEIFLDGATAPLARELFDRKSYIVVYGVEQTIIKLLVETQFEQLYTIRYEYPSLTT